MAPFVSAARFVGVAAAVPVVVADAMRGVCWRDDPACPPLAALSLLRLPYVGFDGALAQGELVVAAAVADEVVTIFARLAAAGFPIARMTRIEAFGGDDDASMAANNCSAFNFRVIAGTTRLSQHAGGLAIDINPVQNPWVVGDRVLPASGAAYLDRDDVRPGMIVRPGPVTNAFDEAGWTWGGDWEDTRDYHHFQRWPRA